MINKENGKKFFGIFKIHILYNFLMLLILLFLLFITFLLYTYNYLSLLNAYLFYIIFFLVIHILFSYIKKNKINKELGLKKQPFIYYLFGYIYMRVLGILALFGLISLFFIYQNDIKPAEMKSYKLVNKVSGKEIYFQGMAHIGKNDFYKKVAERIKKYSNNGYVLFYEGVSIDSDDEINELQNNIGIKPTEELYLSIGKILGDDIVNQDNDMLIKASNNNAINADVKASELLKNNTKQTLSKTKDKNLIADNHKIKDKNKDLIVDSLKTKKEDKNISVKNETNSSKNDNLANKNKDIKKQVNDNKDKDLKKQINDNVEKQIINLSDKNNQTLSFALKGLFNFILKNEWIQNYAIKLQSGSNNSFFKDKILDLRNKKLAEKVATSNYKKIFITYGSMHFTGFLNELNNISKKRNEGTYEIVEVEKTRVF